MYRHRQFSGDPHPGNFLLLDDGRMAFLDFGLFKRIDRRRWPSSSSPASAPGIEGDARASCTSCCAEAGFLPRPRALPSPTSCSRSSTTSTWWYIARRGDRSSTPEIATEVMIEMSDPRSSALRPDAPRDAAARPPLRPAPGDAHARRASASCARAANWHRIAREWMYGDEPVTELGRAGGGVLRAPPAVAREACDRGGLRRARPLGARSRRVARFRRRRAQRVAVGRRRARPRRRLGAAGAAAVHRRSARA